VLAEGDLTANAQLESSAISAKDICGPSSQPKTANVHGKHHHKKMSQLAETFSKIFVSFAPPSDRGIDPVWTIPHWDGSDSTLFSFLSKVRAVLSHVEETKLPGVVPKLRQKLPEQYQNAFVFPGNPSSISFDALWNKLLAAVEVPGHVLGAKAAVAMLKGWELMGSANFVDGVDLICRAAPFLSDPVLDVITGAAYVSNNNQLSAAVRKFRETNPRGKPEDLRAALWHSFPDATKAGYRRSRRSSGHCASRNSSTASRHHHIKVASHDGSARRSSAPASDAFRIATATSTTITTITASAIGDTRRVL
jgi:hypothetical protein